LWGHKKEEGVIQGQKKWYLWGQRRKRVGVRGRRSFGSREKDNTVAGTRKGEFWG
jgi:hypothetical protein